MMQAATERCVVAIRTWLLVTVALASVNLFALTAQAQNSPPPQKAQQLLELLEDPEVKAWLESKGAGGGAVPERSATFAEMMAGWEAAVRARIDGLAAAFMRLPREFADAAAVVHRDVNSGNRGVVLLILAVLVFIGLAAERLAVRALSRGQVPGTPGSFAGEALSRSAGLLAFAVASAGIFLLFEWSPLLSKIVLTLLVAIIALRVVWTAAELFFQVAHAGADPGGADMPDLAEVRFWPRTIAVMAGFLLFGWAVVSIFVAIGFSVDAVRLIALLFGLGILATAVHAVWRRPGGYRSLGLATALTVYLIVLWLLWVGGMTALLFIGVYALLLPPLVRHVGSIAQFIAVRVQPGGALGVILNVLVVRGARAAVIILAVAWLAYVFRLRMAALSADATVSTLFSGALNAVIVLLLADLVWQLAKALIAHRIDAASASQDPDAIARSGRLRTLLPIFRNTLAALIATVAVMTILAGLGVQIGPLIAGAGIFGVAIGFGSQTLVKDVLSGVFYMLDDAFRVGEYIKSGSYMGTVESFSLRSVRLRHHRGPIFTVPFGELGAVQNMSRDWVIEKMTIKVTYDSDVELARKLIKKIGLELAADPEFAADTIQPLKMQGIDNFGDFAVELKMKLMTKPNAQFTMKRRALMMIKKVFAENGIKIAVPTVHVEGGSEGAAAQQAMKMTQAAANQA
jgi:small-conductance mechanosensitive channel